MMKRKNGFTIVELVIVIAVIAILAAVLIPTFANLIEKANMSVDMQTVRQMNTILATDEVVDGKPATVVDAQKVLADNGADDFTPMDSNNVYYWVGSDNRVILWSKAENKVTYPEEYAKQYKDVTEPSADWSDLSIEYDSSLVVVQPDADETVGEALVDAIENAESGAIIKLPANSTADIGGDAYWLSYYYLKNNGGTGKDLTIDLNGGSLISTGDFIYNGQNYGHYSITVPTNGTLTIVNGTVEIATDRSDKAAFGAETGAHLVLRNVEVQTNGAAIFPSGDASEVVIEDSVIYTTGSYAIGTTRGVSNNVRITINNSEITSSSSTGILCNVPADVHINNSTITGVVHAIAVRAGHIEITDSTLITTDTVPGIFAYDNFAQGYNFQGWWHSGNTMPAGTLVVGDYAQANGDGSFSYSGDAIVTLVNTKLQSADSTAIPEILMAASDPAKTVSVSYDTASSVGRAVVYGEVWNGTDDNVGVTFAHPGIITINGEEKTFN